MTYFDATLELDPIEEQKFDPILPEERHVFELIGFERSEPDQWRKDGGIRWTWRVFEADGRTPFIFQDEQFTLRRTTNHDKKTRKPLFTVGTQANDWASALLGRPLGADAHFNVSELRGKRFSAMVVWKAQKGDPKKKSIELASLRHIPVGDAPSTAPSRVQNEAEAAADQAIEDMEREALIKELTQAVKTAKKFNVPAYQTFQDALDAAGSASLEEIQGVLTAVKTANEKALDE